MLSYRSGWQRTILRFEPVSMFLLFWVVYLINIILPIDLNAFGIAPRKLMGLFGIATMPFLHGSLFHILSNSLPFLILGALVRAHGRSQFWFVTLVVMIVGGIGTWLFSAGQVVVGASGLIFGYWAFSLSYGLMKRSIKSIAISIVVFLVYGTMVFSFFKLHFAISWAAHFCGAFAGFLAAYIVAKNTHLFQKNEKQ